MVKVKDIGQCKHPNSRKTNALLKQIKKEKSREKSKKSGNVKLNLVGEKIAWFKAEINEESNQTEKPTPEKVLKLIDKYLSRFDGELEQIKIKHSIGNRKNRQHANREDIINMTIKAEKEEFSGCGFEIPDLLNNVQFNLLMSWDGELRYLSNFKLRRYSKAYLQNLIKKAAKPVCSGESDNKMDI